VDEKHRNQLSGGFIDDLVGEDHFEVDRFMDEQRLEKLDVLHADIQGAETAMLEGCKRSFQKEKVSAMPAQISRDAMLNSSKTSSF
jgi:hypothetical protein